MAQGQGNVANSNLVKGAGCGTREWREDFVLSDTDGVTALFKVAKADGAITSKAMTVAGNLSFSGLYLETGIEAGLIAHAGGTQAGALALSATVPVHVVATVGSAADSVKLPLATGSGAVHTISNQAAANSMQVFGSGTDTINAVATATGVALAAGKTASYTDYAAGKWFAQIGA